MKLEGSWGAVKGSEKAFDGGRSLLEIQDAKVMSDDARTTFINSRRRLNAQVLRCTSCKSTRLTQGGKLLSSSLYDLVVLSKPCQTPFLDFGQCSAATEKRHCPDCKYHWQCLEEVPGSVVHEEYSFHANYGPVK